MLILASESPRRKTMLEDHGLEFSIVPADIDESRIDDESPWAMVERLAFNKASYVAAKHPDSIILAADTVVALDEHILGKPEDMADARKMIELLSGQTHEVYTGVCLLRLNPAIERSWVAATHVTFNRLTEEQIDHYLEISSPLDKAGAYAIQEHEELLVKSYDGLYSNVVGFPIEEVLVRLPDFE